MHTRRGDPHASTAYEAHESAAELGAFNEA